MHSKLSIKIILKVIYFLIYLILFCVNFFLMQCLVVFAIWVLRGSMYFIRLNTGMCLVYLLLFFFGKAKNYINFIKVGLID